MNDLSNKSRLDPGEENSAAQQLREDKRPANSLDNLINLAAGIGGIGQDDQKRQQDSSDNQKRHRSGQSSRSEIGRSGEGLPRERGKKQQTSPNAGLMSSPKSSRITSGESEQDLSPESDQGAFSRAGESLEEVIQKGTKLEALKQARSLGFYLRKEIKKGKFDSFIVVLIFSIVKDFVDIPTAGTVGTVLNVFITGTLTVIFFLQTSVFKKFLIKKFLWKYILVFIIEFIPGFNIFPSYTLSAILLKLKINKKIRKLQNQLEEAEKEAEKLRKELRLKETEKEMAKLDKQA